MATTRIGLVNHFTMSTPDVAANKYFWLEFMGASWYSESYRLIQFLIGGILVDCFPPVDPDKEEDQPHPGSDAQTFRFSVPADSFEAWVQRAEEYEIGARLMVQDELRRMSLLCFAPGGYHVALESAFPSSEELQAAVQAVASRVSRLSPSIESAQNSR